MRVSQNFTGVGVGVRESQENPKLTPSFQPATKVATFRSGCVPGVWIDPFLSKRRERAKIRAFRALILAVWHNPARARVKGRKMAEKRVISCYAIYKHIRARVTLRV